MRRMLEQAEAFRVMAEGSPVLMWVTDQRGEIVYVNRAYLEFFGVTREKVSTLDWRTLVHPDDFDSYVNGFAQSLTGRTAFHAYARVKRHDGEWRWVRSDGAPFFSSSGELLGMVGSSPDMTDRIKAENALQESEARFKRLADAMPQLVWVAADDGTVSYYNSRAERYAGIRRTERGYEWRAMIHPEDVAESLAKWQAAVASARPYQFEHRLRMADGTYRWHLSRADRLRAPARAQWFGTATDIHEIKEAQQALQELDRSKSEFIAMLAHELRNPLSTAATATHLLAASRTLDENARHALQVLQRQIGQMTRLMEDLLDVNRVAAGKIDLRPGNFDLANLVDELVETWRAAGRFESHRVLLQRTPTPVRADRARMQQIVSNLVENALKFSSPGSQISLDVRTRNKRAILVVRDSGRGFPPEESQRLFDLFRQSRDEDHSAGGLGLGLTIVKRLVEAQGGTVAAFSEGVGRGAVFTVSLPSSGDQPNSAATAAAGGTTS